MDRRIVFFVVFVITLVSTVLVFSICLLAHQPIFETTLYSVVTMWIMGIVSQLLLQNLYQAIVKPLEDSQRQQIEQRTAEEINLKDIEEIDQATEILQQEQQEGLQGSAKQNLGSPTVGVHVEQKG